MNSIEENRHKVNWKNLFCCALLFFAVLIPATVAGMKDLDVGVDLGVNVTNPVESVANHRYDFLSYMSDDIIFTDQYTGKEKNASLESGYKILIYVLSLLSTNPNFIMIMLQLLTMLFIILFAYELRDRTSTPFVMLIFMLVWWYISFSLMRQSLAMAIGFFSIALFMKRKYFWSIVWLLVAVSIHSSSLILLIIIALIAISQSNMAEKAKNIIYGSYIGLLVIVGLLFNPIVNILASFADSLPEQYAKYFVNMDGIDTNGGALLITITFLVAAIVCYAILKKKCRVDWRLLVILLLTDLLFSILSFRMMYMYRFGYYFNFLALFLLIPNLPLITEDKLGRILIAGACVLLLFGVWYRRVVISNWANMFPYRSEVLHISQTIDKKEKYG